MSQRAQALADQFGAASQAFITTFEALGPDQLAAHCAGEQCSVAALGAHVAGVHRMASAWIQTAALGQPLPTLTMAEIDEANAVQFARDAVRPAGATLAELRQHSAQAARLVRGLSDAELDRGQPFSLFGGEVTAEDLVRNVLIADVQGHLGSLKAVAVDAVSASSR
jgi:hypothetical protein